MHAVTEAKSGAESASADSVTQCTAEDSTTGGGRYRNRLYSYHSEPEWGWAGPVIRVASPE